MCFSKKILKIYITIFAFLSIFIVESYPQDKNYISFSTAIFDILQQKSPSFEGRGELRMGAFEFLGHPFAGLMFNAEGAAHIYAGIYYDISIGNYFILTPSFAPGLYAKSGSKDLKYTLEFQSQIELTYILNNDSRIGFSFNHISNASLGKKNPGVESLALTYVVPF